MEDFLSTRKEVKDLIAYLRLLVNENDSEALMRIINYPARGIGETTQNKLIVFADAQNVPFQKFWIISNVCTTFRLKQWCFKQTE
jgi:DNA helicase-2/ATP-dependent DNA helicase PcrA